MTNTHLHAKLSATGKKSALLSAFFLEGNIMRTMEWNAVDKQLRMIDQRELPSSLEYVALTTYQSVADAITNMTVRGAPAIGVSAAFGVVLAANQYAHLKYPNFLEELRKAIDYLSQSRPTAVNLSWALSRMWKKIDKDCQDTERICAVLLEEAQRMADEDVEANLSLSRYGAEIIADGDTIIHHCNTGALAAVDWGTALGVIRMAYEQGKKIHVLVDETRPRLQGSRLTAWELNQYQIPFDIINDSAAGYFLSKGLVQKVIFGADRVARNGDVANKIGSYMLALAAHDNHVPVYSAFPLSTVDLDVRDGDEIIIEERDQSEVLDIKYKEETVCPPRVTARNPAFDITPHHLFTGLITEKGIIYPPFEKNISEAILG